MLYKINKINEEEFDISEFYPSKMYSKLYDKLD